MVLFCVCVCVKYRFIVDFSSFVKSVCTIEFFIVSSLGVAQSCVCEV